MKFYIHTNPILQKERYALQVAAWKGMTRLRRTHLARVVISEPAFSNNSTIQDPFCHERPQPLRSTIENILCLKNQAVITRRNCSVEHSNKLLVFLMNLRVITM